YSLSQFMGILISKPCHPEQRSEWAMNKEPMLRTGQS
ncbi:MAG: hypothetical protein ACI9Y8_000690, partial [Candidatus Omnitrophota bacterium]